MARTSKSIRSSLNRAWGHWATRRQVRKQYRSRTLLVADHWDGSVQQFYHFMLGYFMPVCAWVDRYPGKPIAVRDCGPMNVWFETLRSHVDLLIVPPGSALHMVVGRRMRHVVLRGADDPRGFNQRRLREGADLVRRLVGVPRPSNRARRGGIVVIDRATSEDFYHQGASETHMSGKERRWVPNLSELPEHLGSDELVTIVDFARMEPSAQLSVDSETLVIVGQHGAGLAHMLWMPEPGGVIEIAPPLPEQVEDLFGKLAKVLGFQYRKINQSGAHAPVDLEAVADAVRDVLASLSADLSASSRGG